MKQSNHTIKYSECQSGQCKSKSGSVSGCGSDSDSDSNSDSECGIKSAEKCVLPSFNNNKHKLLIQNFEFHN